MVSTESTPESKSTLTTATCSLRDVAQLAGVSLRTVERLEAKGLVPGRIRHLHRLRFARAAIDAWLSGEK
jgi:predicted DNA-binding transcriptional regulator AlpA